MLLPALTMRRGIRRGSATECRYPAQLRAFARNQSATASRSSEKANGS